MGKNFEAFRDIYPDGENYVVANNIDRTFKRQYKGLTITFLNARSLIKKLMP